LVREVAEYPNSFSPLAPGEERIETARYTLCVGLGSFATTVQRQRFAAGELDEVVDEVRSLLRERGRTRTQWEVGSRAEPQDLVELLQARGVVLDRDPYAVALVLTEPPPPGPPSVVARRVETFEEFEAANEVQWEAFEAPSEDVEEARGLLPRRWSDMAGLMHAVWLDGEVVAAGTCAVTEHGLLLYGGATRPRARGRGAYRALLCARWDEAVSLGTPALLTQGGAMSKPILERLGFRAVGHVHILLDEFG
jgi:hypothetical protein